jgi:hypothetical protein
MSPGCLMLPQPRGHPVAFHPDQPPFSSALWSPCDSSSQRRRYRDWGLPFNKGKSTVFCEFGLGFLRPLFSAQRPSLGFAPFCNPASALFTHGPDFCVFGNVLQPIPELRATCHYMSQVNAGVFYPAVPLMAYVAGCSGGLVAVYWILDGGSESPKAIPPGFEGGKQ